MGEQRKGPEFKLPPGAGMAGKVIGALAVVAGAGYTVVNHCLYNVESGFRAVEYNRLTGMKAAVFPEGTHFKLPWFDRVTMFDVRAKPCQITSKTGSRDLQMVDVSLRVLHRPNVNMLPEVYKQYGSRYDQVVLPSIINEVLKAVVAQFVASELITQREKVSHMIRENLVARARRFMIELDDVAITHLAFGAEYTAAVEAKQVAQQESERAKFLVTKALQDKKSTVIRAEGEAKSAKLIGDAIKGDPNFLELRRIEAAREVANIISTSQNKLYISADSLLLNLMDKNSHMTVEGGK